MQSFGHNRGYIDELYKTFLEDPTAVSEAWQDFFRDYRPESDPVPGREPAETAAAQKAPGRANAKRLVGVAAKIVENMDASLEVPTATSARSIPVKMLEENRRVINAHQATVSGPRISFTHLIAWAIVRALEQHAAMNAAFASEDGEPYVLQKDTVNLGLAIDVEKNGERILLVPNIKNAAALDFPGLVSAYDDLVARARLGKLTLDDFEGTTLTLTNPGMLGTALSVPRLMNGQGAIIGTGAIGYPAEYSGMAREMTSALGISKTMTVTSTYDHRVIQGAESGRFLLELERLLRGEQRFYERLFADLGVPQEPFEYAGDRNPLTLGGAGSHDAIAKQAGVLQLIRAFRVRGHLWADLDPLSYRPEPTPELEMSTYGLTVWDLDRQFIAGGLGGHHGTLELRTILETLQRTYCWHVGVEYMHIQDTDIRQWLQERTESPGQAETLERDLQVRILKRLNVAEAFETFLHTNYVGQKRFSLEGCETLIPMLDAMLEDASQCGIEEVVMGMAHRGRLNVLAHVVGKPYGQIFLEFEGVDPQSTHGSGDVKYHLGAEGSFTAANGRQIRVHLASNPSHLEAVNPVVQGMARARSEKLDDPEHSRVLPLLIHGDGSFAGQGVVAETLSASQLSGYRTGGTVHVVINNQIGFTTGPADARSSTYPTDVAKMVRAPIFHVNGDHPEDAVRVIRLALAFRQRFKRDVVVDLFCYRRWGHNEGDDPSYTHPILYSRIKNHRSARKLYTERLMRRGDLDQDQAELALEHFREHLRHVHDEVREAEKDRDSSPGASRPATPEPREAAEPATAVDRPDLERVLDGLNRTPKDFHLHPKLAGQLAKRRERFEADRIDWALAESLAFGTLVLDGIPVRLSGEDSIRGTFSQRHAAFYDHENGERWVPLAHLDPGQARFSAYDSHLSEFAVMGFEYGYSVDYPESLVMWEAQFGDFANGGQVIIDQFLVSAESKWGQRNGLVLLLPHGFEGQGPEHSSARLERFLQLAAQDNIQVCCPTTPAQYFHLLRRQAMRERRKPLVVMTPKSLLRLPDCVSAAARLTSGRFEPVLGDHDAREPGDRLVICSGKVFYDLSAFRKDHETVDASILRLEQLYPFPEAELRSKIEGCGPVRDVLWVQEEPRNMGGWDFVRPYLRELIPPEASLRYVGRPASASPATGSARRHVAEQDSIVREALVTAAGEIPAVGGAAPDLSQV